MIVNNPSGAVFAGALGIEGGTLRLAALLKLTPGQYDWINLESIARQVAQW